MTRNLLIRMLQCALLILAASACSQVTNDLFLPEEQWLLGPTFKDYNFQIQAAAIKAGECYSAQYDTNGHWGSPQYGLQLSIRSSTNVFSLNEPILISVILRNTTTNPLPFFDFSGGMQNHFVVEDENGHILPENDFGPGTSGGPRDLAGKRQVKNEYDLNSEFAFKAGIYKIHAQQKSIEISPINKIVAGITNLCSGTLMLRIVPR